MKKKCSPIEWRQTSAAPNNKSSRAFVDYQSFGGPFLSLKLRDDKLSFRTSERGAPHYGTPHISNVTQVALKNFWDKIEAINTWKWHSEYINNNVLDGISWRIELQHGEHCLKSNGQNAYPGINGHVPTTPFIEFMSAIASLIDKPSLLVWLGIYDDTVVKSNVWPRKIREENGHYLLHKVHRCYIDDDILRFEFERTDGTTYIGPGYTSLVNDNKPIAFKVLKANKLSKPSQVHYVLVYHSGGFPNGIPARLYKEMPTNDLPLQRVEAGESLFPFTINTNENKSGSQENHFSGQDRITRSRAKLLPHTPTITAVLPEESVYFLAIGTRNGIESGYIIHLEYREGSRVSPETLIATAVRFIEDFEFYPNDDPALLNQLIEIARSEGRAIPQVHDR